MFFFLVAQKVMVQFTISDIFDEIPYMPSIVLDHEDISVNNTELPAFMRLIF